MSAQKPIGLMGRKELEEEVARLRALEQAAVAAMKHLEVNRRDNEIYADPVGRLFDMLVRSGAMELP